MHDGQMLFDSSITWNKQEWKVDETMSKLIEENKIIPTIVVGIWNSGTTRHADYFPEKPIAYLPKQVKDTLIDRELLGKARANNYLKFIVQELKPFIDSSFSTFKDAKNTFIAGSSMGGLISWYAISEYPTVFSGAACLSTHWVGSIKEKSGAIPKAFVTYAKEKLPNPNNHKIYFDYGTITLDSLYEPHQKAIDRVMQTKGYRKNKKRPAKYSVDRNTGVFCENFRHHFRFEIHPDFKRRYALPAGRGAKRNFPLYQPEKQFRFRGRKNDFPAGKSGT
jgi:pimeloyl-ACP methyl ester carboxylesterase